MTAVRHYFSGAEFKKNFISALEKHGTQRFEVRQSIFPKISPIERVIRWSRGYGRTDGRTDARTDGPTDERTDQRTDTPSYRVVVYK